MFKIQTTKVIGGEAVSVPILPVDSRKTADAKLAELVADCEAEFNAPAMRHVGGWAEIFLQSCDSIFGDGASDIAHITVKRPLHSPKAMVHRRDFE